MCCKSAAAREMARATIANLLKESRMNDAGIGAKLLLLTAWAITLTLHEQVDFNLLQSQLEATEEQCG
eukprot:2484761-Amphidinium_carterae.1